MKKCLFLLCMLSCSFAAQAVELNGKYLSQSGELLFRFTPDSLYIDIAQSQRNVSSYNAYETYLKDGRETYREVLIRVTAEKHNEYILEYYGKDKDRDYNSNERYHIKPVK